MIECWSAGFADQNMAEDILLELGPIVMRTIPGGRPAPGSRSSCLATSRSAPRHKCSTPAADGALRWNALEKAGYSASGRSIAWRTSSSIAPIAR